MGAFTIPEGDLLPALEEQLLDGAGSPVPLPQGSTVQLVVTRRREDPPIIDRAAVVLDGPSGRVSHEWQAGDTDEAGEYLYVWIVEFGGAPGRPQTFPSNSPNKLTITRRLRRAAEGGA